MRRALIASVKAVRSFGIMKYTHDGVNFRTETVRAIPQSLYRQIVPFREHSSMTMDEGIFKSEVSNVRDLLAEDNFGDAELQSKKIMLAVEKQSGKSSPQYREILKYHLQALMGLKKFVAVESLGLSAFELYSTELGKSHVDTIDIMNFLANSLHYQGKHSQASRLYVIVLESQLALTPTDIHSPESVQTHDELIASFRDIAFAYVQSDAMDSAAQILNSIIKIQGGLFGPSHPKAIQSLSDLALLMCAIRHVDHAEALVNELISIYSQLAGPDCNEVVLWKKNLASVFCVAGKPEEADRLFTECLASLRKRFPEDHEEVREAKELLASVKPVPEENGVFKDAGL